MSTTTTTTPTIRPAFPELPTSSSPTQVSLNHAFAPACARRIALLGSKRPYIIASNSIATKTDHVKNLQAALGQVATLAGTWVGIEAHTPWDSLIAVVGEVRGNGADCLVSLGGGSVADAGKIVVCAVAANVHTLSDFESFIARGTRTSPTADTYDLTSLCDPTIPSIFIPTTLSGAEYTKWSGCTNPHDRSKYQFSHPKMYADLVILDPTLTLDTPGSMWLSSGIRAVDHCVEGICSSMAREEVSVMLCRGLKLVVVGLLGCKRDEGDLEARKKCMEGANLAIGWLIAGVMAGASHGIGHMLGPIGGVAHGETSCVLLPAVMKYNKPVNGGQQEMVKEALWGEVEIAEVLERRGLVRQSSDAGDALKELFKELGLPTSLTEVGFDMGKMELLAKSSLKDYLLETNPRPLTKVEEVMELLEKCV